MTSTEHHDEACGPTSSVGLTLRYLVAGLWWVGGLAILVLASATGELTVWLSAVDLVVGLMMLLTIRWRHRRPVLIGFLFAVATGITTSGLAVSFWALAHLSTRRRWAEILPASALAVVGGMFWGVSSVLVGTWQLEWDPAPPTWIEIAVVSLSWMATMGAAVALGMYTGARRELVNSLRERARSAEREQALRQETARAEERSRIAREMHDVVAHRISIVAMHAGALAYRDDLPPEQTRTVAASIRDNAQQALTELRSVIGELRNVDEATGVNRPQPTLAALDGLIAENREAGLQVTVRDSTADRGELPDHIGRHAYRLVQEGLTNARKHSPKAPARLSLSGDPTTGLSIEISNALGQSPAEIPGGGHGLTGMAERVSLVGGRFEAGPCDDGYFHLTAWLPWPSQ